jgi:hypothetical protein
MRIVSSHSTPGPPRPAILGIALLGALALVAAGCGTHLVKVDSSVLRLRVDEYSITPQDIQVHAGRLKIEATNTGILTHIIRIEIEHPAPGDSGVIGGTGVIQPGQKLTSPKVTLSPGRYRLVDTIANHADLGDYGSLTVVP